MGDPLRDPHPRSLLLAWAPPGGRLAVLLLALLFATPAPFAGGSEIDFDQHILPILEQRCVTCHRAVYRDTDGRFKKPKGGLRLDSPKEMRDAVDLIVPGDAEASLLFELVALPADDPERMPQDDEPLSLREVELLRRWIDGGASFGDWTGEGEAGTAAGDPSADEPPRIRALRELAAGLKPPGRSARVKASGDRATIVDVLPGGALVDVHFRSHEAEVTDADVARLLAIQENITSLRLAGTPVGDESLKAARSMPALTRLDLRSTRVTQAGLRSLSGHAELRYLNLSDTAIDDEAVESIAALPKLESVFLFGSEVTEEGARRLRGLRPDLYVQRGLRLPTDSARAEGGGR